MHGKLASSAFYLVSSYRLKYTPVLALSLKNASMPLPLPCPGPEGLCGQLATTSVARAISCLEEKGGKWKLLRATGMTMKIRHFYIALCSRFSKNNILY